MSLRLILISEACVMRLHYQMSVMNIKHNDSYSLGYTNTPSASRISRVRSDVLTVLFFSCWFTYIEESNKEKTNNKTAVNTFPWIEVHHQTADDVHAEPSPPPITWAGAELVTRAPQTVRWAKPVSSGGIAKDMQCQYQRGVCRIMSREIKREERTWTLLGIDCMIVCQFHIDEQHLLFYITLNLSDNYNHVNKDLK